MNNKNWIAIFLGLACLVLFVGVISTSNNWLNNSQNNENGATPQQINQTIRENDANTSPNQDVPTKINGNEIMNDMGMNNNSNDNTNNQNDTNVIDDATNDIANDVANAMPNMGR